MARWCAGGTSSSMPVTTPSRRARRWKRRSADRDEAYQAAITAASNDCFSWVTGKYDYVNPPAQKRLMVAGAILRAFPQEVLETCYSAANEIYADLSKSNPHFGKLYASLTAYRSDSLMWMQVAELSFDSFMMRMRTRT